MKKIASLLLSVALATGAFAGTAATVAPSGKAGKGVVLPPPPPSCDWFAPGLKVGVFVAGLLPEGSGGDEIGGGVLAEYFFTENFGIEASYGVFATDPEHHEYDLALVARLPIESLCIAPYVMVGGGGSSNSDNRGNYFVGGGIEAHLSGNMGIFADGAYHFAADSDDQDYTLVRLGLKFRL